MDKVTVIGETMDRVTDFAKSINASENLYKGFTSYKKWADKGKVGKVFAEIFGKLSNAKWLIGKLRKGYTIFDIGIDTSRATRSSSYILEQIITFIWETRNVIKGIVQAIKTE